MRRQVFPDGSATRWTKSWTWREISRLPRNSRPRLTLTAGRLTFGRHAPALFRPSNRSASRVF